MRLDSVWRHATINRMNDTTDNDLTDDLSDAQEIAAGLHKVKQRYLANKCDFAEFKQRTESLWAFARGLGLSTKEVNKALNDL
jgi:hypothetical protein